jgi:hypothetical protein
MILKLGGWLGANNSPPQKSSMLSNVTQGLDLGIFFVSGLGLVTVSCEHGNEPLGFIKDGIFF